MKLLRTKPEEKFEKKGTTTKGLEITHMATISMEHISQATAEAMMVDGMVNKFMVPIYTKSTPNDNGPGFGFYVYLDSQCLKDGDFPEDLAAVIELALDNGCDILCLDSDGPVIEGLPVYEWRD